MLVFGVFWDDIVAKSPTPLVIAAVVQSLVHGSSIRSGEHGFFVDGELLLENFQFLRRHTGRFTLLLSLGFYPVCSFEIGEL